MAIIASATGLKPKLTLFTPESGFLDKRLKPQEVLTTLKNDQYAPQDVVFFYYSGHGARPVSSDDPYPQMKMGNYDQDFLPLSKIHTLLKSKKPKLAIVMGDLCNSVLAGLTPKSVILKNQETKIDDTNRTNFQKLFTQLKGNLIVCSSQPGNTSIALKEGGAFTLSFLVTLEAMIAGKLGTPNWKSLLQATGQVEYKAVKRKPYFDLDLSNAGSSIAISDEPTYIESSESDIANLVNTLLSIADNTQTALKRIQMEPQVLAQVFANPNAKVEIVGRNGKTILDRIRAQVYTSRIATSRGLRGLSLRKYKKENGKFTYIQIHEIHSQ